MTQGRHTAIQNFIKFFLGNSFQKNYNIFSCEGEGRNLKIVHINFVGIQSINQSTNKQILKKLENENSLLFPGKN